MELEKKKKKFNYKHTIENVAFIFECYFEIINIIIKHKLFDEETFIQKISENNNLRTIEVRLFDIYNTLKGEISEEKEKTNRVTPDIPCFNNMIIPNIESCFLRWRNDYDHKRKIYSGKPEKILPALKTSLTNKFVDLSNSEDIKQICDNLIKKTSTAKRITKENLLAKNQLNDNSIIKKITEPNADIEDIYNHINYYINNPVCFRKYIEKNNESNNTKKKLEKLHKNFLKKLENKLSKNLSKKVLKTSGLDYKTIMEDYHKVENIKHNQIQDLILALSHNNAEEIDIRNCLKFKYNHDYNDKIVTNYLDNLMESKKIEYVNNKFYPIDKNLCEASFIKNEDIIIEFYFGDKYVT